MVDLALMARVKLNKKTGIAKIGAGARMGPVYKVCEPPASFAGSASPPTKLSCKAALRGCCGHCDAMLRAWMAAAVVYSCTCVLRAQTFAGLRGQEEGSAARLPGRQPASCTCASARLAEPGS